MADEIFLVRDVLIEPPPAMAFQKAPEEFVTVQDAEAADRALADPGNSHHCPLCNQYFGGTAFAAHAQSCIKANAPAWERQRDREPSYSKTKQFRGRLFGARGK